jgi:hypothetical protein
MLKIFAFLAAAADIARRLLGMKERAEQQEIGATKQREADQKETLKAKDDQLEKAVNRRGGDGGKRLRGGNF